MKALTDEALRWWWSVPEEQQLDLEIRCLEESLDLSELIYILSGQVFADLQGAQQGKGRRGHLREADA